MSTLTWLMLRIQKQVFGWPMPEALQSCLEAEDGTWTTTAAMADVPAAIATAHWHSARRASYDSTSTPSRRQRSTTNATGQSANSNRVSRYCTTRMPKFDDLACSSTAVAYFLSPGFPWVCVSSILEYWTMLITDIRISIGVVCGCIARESRSSHSKRVGVMDGWMRTKRKQPKVGSSS
jgi:hypothetical protein